MSDEQKPKPKAAEVQPHQSSVRRTIAKVSDALYVAARSLDEAKQRSDYYVIFEGDYGGQIYLVAPVSKVKCSESQLQTLLREIDSTGWKDPEGAQMYFERFSTGSAVSGGMGGGMATDDIWIHEDLRTLGISEQISDVLDGRRESIVKGV